MATADSNCGCDLESPSRLDEAREIASSVREAGLMIGDNYSGLFSSLGFGKQSNCFVASDFVDLLISKGFAENREGAVTVGQLLMDTDLIHHVADKLHFQDGAHLYRFREDDGDGKGPSAASIRQVKGCHCGYLWKKGYIFWSKCYFALSCPVSKQLLVYRQELNSSPLFNYSFSEAVLVPDFKKKYPELRIDLTLVNRNSVTIFIAASTEEDLFGWIKAFGNTGAKVLDSVQTSTNPSEASSVFDFSEKDIHGKEYSFEQDRGKVMLFVNVASG